MNCALNREHYEFLNVLLQFFVGNQLNIVNIPELWADVKIQLRLKI